MIPIQHRKKIVGAAAAGAALVMAANLGYQAEGERHKVYRDSGGVATVLGGPEVYTEVYFRKVV